MGLFENENIFKTVVDSAATGIAVMAPVQDDAGKIINFSVLLFNKYMLDLIKVGDYKGKLYTEIFPTFKESGILERFIQLAETGDHSFNVIYHELMKSQLTLGSTKSMFEIYASFNLRK